MTPTDQIQKHDTQTHADGTPGADQPFVEAPLVYDIIQRPDIKAVLADNPTPTATQLIAIAIASVGLLVLVRTLAPRQNSIIPALSTLALLITISVGFLATRPSVDQITITLQTRNTSTDTASARDRITLYHARRSTQLDIDLRLPQTRILLPNRASLQALYNQPKSNQNTHRSPHTQHLSLPRGGSVIVYHPHVTSPPGATHQRGTQPQKPITIPESTLIRLRQRLDQSNLRNP